MKTGMNMKTLLAAAALAVAALAAGSAPASATTLLVDEGAYTYDSATGFDWLDLTATNGQSMSNAVSYAAANGAGSGWRIASFSEVLSLYQDAGISLTLSAPNYYTALVVDLNSYDSSMNNLLTLLGAGNIGSYYENSNGWFKGLTDGWYGMAIIDLATDVTGHYSAVDIYGNVAAGDPSSSIYGTYLIRDHGGVTPPTVTPLPAALPMFAAATGLMGLMGWKRRKSGQA